MTSIDREIVLDNATKWFWLNKFIGDNYKAFLENGTPLRLIMTTKEAGRTLEQNAKMWAMLTDISSQVDWYGKKLSTDDWKHVFTAALSGQNVVPGINGGFVVLGKPTSKMTKREKSDLIMLMEAFGAERDVKFKIGEVENDHTRRA